MTDSPEQSPAAKSSDYRLVNGDWESTRDVLADLAEGGDVDEYLKATGWEEFFTLGERDGRLRVVSMRRWRPDRTGEYLIYAEDILVVSSFMLVSSLPELMDLLARWAPAVQAAAVSGLIEDLGESVVSSSGIVEKIAARARYGVETTHDSILREQRQRQDAARIQRQQRQNE